MLTALALMLLSQTTPAIRRSTPLPDDPGYVVRQVGTVNTNCLNCSTVVASDGGFLGSVSQGRALDGGTGWGVYIEGGNLSVTSSASISFDGGSIGYMVMPDGGALEVYVVNPSGASGGGWVPDGGFIGSVYVITDGGAVTSYQGGAWSVSISNFPGTQPISGTVSVSNFPATQPVSGTVQVSNPTMNVYVVDAGPVPVFGVVNVGNSVGVTGPLTDAQLRATPVPVSGFPGSWYPDGGALGSVTVSNFPATQPVSGTITVGNPTLNVYVVDAGALPVFGTVNVGNTVAVSGTVAVSNQNGTWYPDGGSIGSVSVSNFPATTTVVQSTAANLNATVTGTVAATQSGTWTVRNQDGAGNALASSTTTPAGTEQALIVRPIPSGTQAVSGTVTANIGTSGSLALDSTLTGGTQKAIARGGAKGATTAADVTSTSVDANTQALDVSVKGTATVSGSVTVSGTVAATQSGTWSSRTQDGAGNALASSTTTPTGTEQALIVRPIPSGTQTVSGTVAATQSGTWNITNVSGTVSLPTGAATETTLGTRLADSTFTGRFGAAAALADATANPSVTTIGSYLMGYNGTTWDRLRKSATGLLVDIGNTSIAVTQSGAWTVAATQSGTWNVGLSAGTNYVGKTRLTDGTLDVTLLNSAPGSDTGQVSVPVRIISSLAGGAGGTSSSYAAAFPATGTAAGFNDGTNMQGARVFDADTGAGTQYVLGTNLRVSANGGSTEAAAGAGTTSASTLRVVLPTDQTVIPVSDNGGTLTVDGTVAVSGVGGTVTVSGTVTADTELPAAAALADATANPSTTSVGSLGLMYNGASWDRIRGTTAAGLLVNVSNSTLAATQSGTWNIGTLTSISNPVTVAQATAANLRAQLAGESAPNAALPSVAETVSFSDGTNAQVPRVYDVDTSGSTQWAAGAQLVVANFGGARTITGTGDGAGNNGLTVWNLTKITSTVTNTAVTCATTATLAPASVATDRTTVTFYNNSSVTIYLGGASVSTANGLPLLPGASFTDDGKNGAYYCRVASGTADLRVMEQ